MKKTHFVIGVFATLLAALAFAPGCYYDNEQDLYGIDPTACDTSLVKYSTVVQPLLKDNCVNCHSPGGVQESSPLHTYEYVKLFADNGTLVGRTNDVNSPMPQSGLLPTCNRAEIRAWVNRGAPND